MLDMILIMLVVGSVSSAAIIAAVEMTATRKLRQLHTA